MENRMDMKIEKLYGSRPLEGGSVYNERKVRIEILYHQRDYRLGPVPGGFVVKKSRGYCKAFMVDRSNNDDLKFSLNNIFFDARVATNFNPDLEKKLIHNTRSAVLSLPEPTVVNGFQIAPELLVRINLEIRSCHYNTVSSTTRVSSRPRPYPNNNNNNISATMATSSSSSGPIRRSLHSNIASMLTMKKLERIRVASTDVMLEQDWCCALCLESKVLDDGLKVIRLPCKHIFHDDCIVKWLLKRNSCPLCRSRVLGDYPHLYR